MPREAVSVFATALDVPSAWLDQAPIRLEVLHFRHKKRTKAAQRERVTARAVVTRMIVAELEECFEELYRPTLPSIDLPGQPGDPTRVPEIEAAAREVRSAWGMGEGPIPDLVRAVEANGIWVTQLQGEDRCVDAYSWWSDGHAFIALNPVPLDGSDSPAAPAEARNSYRERFNVAHELGHLTLHRDLPEELVGTRDVESEAHRFAAAFLVPASQWRASAPKSISWRDYREHAHRWGVSATTLLRRSRDLGLFDEARYQAAMIRVSSEIGRRGEGLHLPPRAIERPGRLEAHLRALEVQGGITVADVAEDIGLWETDVIDAIGVPPVAAPLGKVIDFKAAQARSGSAGR